MTDELCNRIGKFALTRPFLDDVEDEMLFKLFSEVIVLRAEDRMWDNVVEYYAVSPYFEVVEEGCIYPTYQAKVSTEEDGTQFISWSKI